MSTGKIESWWYTPALFSSVQSLSSICDGNFHRIAFVVSGGLQKLFVDGVLQGSYEFPSLTFGSNWSVAKGDGGSIYYAACSIDELRISNAARYTTAYTPKASAFSSEVSKNLYVDSNSPTTISISTQTGTSYPLVLEDQGKLITMSNASANTLTIPLNSNVAYPVGTWIDVSNIGAGTCTITAGSGVTLNGTDLS